MPSATLWLVDGNQVDEAALNQGKGRLAPSEMRRFAGFKRPERQRQYLIGRMLLRHAVSRTTSIPPSSISVLDRPGAAPLLILPDDVPPGFSLSHSRQWIACATSIDTTLGLDIEVIDVKRDVIALAESSFHPDEHAWLLRQPEAECVEAFYRLWTLKEAQFKLASNCGEQQHVPAMIARDGQLLSQDDRWFSVGLTHPALSITLCSARPLRTIDLVDSDHGIDLGL